MRYGSQSPTARVAPAGVGSYGDKADKMLRLAGVDLMPWQRVLLDDWLSYDGVGLWSAQSCGLSVPRQNGKTYAIAARIAFGMVAFSEWVIYTSHLQKTSTETFETLQEIFESKALKSKVKAIKTAIGREEIVLNNGGRVKFLARTRNGGRGQHGDLWVADEALELNDDQQASFQPCLAASKNPQTIYLSSPPDESSDGEVFRRIRKDALEGATARTAWSEWSTKEIGDIDDRDRWYATNPSLGYLIKERTIEGEAEQTAKDKFARERLGWWDNAGRAEHVIEQDKWDACRADHAGDGIDSYGIKFSADGSRVCLSVCRYSAEPWVELLFDESVAKGIGWLVDWVVERKGKVASVVIDGRSGSTALAQKLESSMPNGVVKIPRTVDVIAANAGLLSSVNEGKLRHGGQSQLAASATLTTKRKIGGDGGWGFGDTPAACAAPIESAALALWGASNTKRKPGRKQRVV